MYIEPNSTIYILKDVPLDDSYDHTLWFDTLAHQQQYFQTKRKFTLTRQSYQRVKRGWMRIEIAADALYDCNYLMFHNSPYATNADGQVDPQGVYPAKWWYAFITSVEYINNRVSEVSFEIDDMQSFYFDYQLGGNFIVRQHSTTDAIGDNLVPEDVAIGNIIEGESYVLPNFNLSANNWSVVLATTVECTRSQNLPIAIPDSAPIGFYGGVPHSMRFFAYHFTDADITTMTTLVKSLNIFKNTDGIVSIFILPNSIIPEAWYGDQSAAPYAQSIGTIQTIDLDNVSSDVGNPTMGNYIPKNNKLLTYPYTFLTVSNNQGTKKVFKYEYFNEDIGKQFKLYFDQSTEPTLALIPHGYNTRKSEMSYYAYMDYNDTIYLSNFPKCAVAISDFNAKLVQLALSTALDALGGKFTEESTVKVPHETRYHISGESRVRKHEHITGKETPFSNVTEKNFNPRSMISRELLYPLYDNINNVTTGKGNTMYSSGGFNFKFTQNYLDEPFAKMVDDYFTRYGYAVKELGTPNLHARTRYTYIELANTVIHGSMPADSESHICSIFNKGITFWADHDNVGNYTLPNNLLS